MLIVALTGGIGAGKSTAAGFFRDKGARVIDSDQIVSELLDTSKELREHLTTEFGSGILDTQGNIDRQALAREVFGIEENTERLNRIVHPYVTRRIEEEIDSFVAETQEPANGFLSEQTLIIEIPLIERVPALLGRFDEVVTISAPVAVRRERLLGRDWTEEDIDARIEAQINDQTRERMADTVIVNDQDEEAFTAGLERWWSSHSEAE